MFFKFQRCFPIAPHFYPILFFSYGVEGNGGILFFWLGFSHHVPINVALSKQQENKTMGETHELMNRKNKREYC